MTRRNKTKKKKFKKKSDQSENWIESNQIGEAMPMIAENKENEHQNTAQNKKNWKKNVCSVREEKPPDKIWTITPLSESANHPQAGQITSLEDEYKYKEYPHTTHDHSAYGWASEGLRCGEFGFTWTTHWRTDVWGHLLHWCVWLGYIGACCRADLVRLHPGLERWYANSWHQIEAIWSSPKAAIWWYLDMYQLTEYRAAWRFARADLRYWRRKTVVDLCTSLQRWCPSPRRRWPSCNGWSPEARLAGGTTEWPPRDTSGW